MSKKRSSLRTWLVLAVGISVLAVVAIILATMDHSTWSYIKHISPLIFVLVLLLVVFRWGATCLRADLLIRAVGERLPFGKVTKAVLSGGFAGAITPYHAAGIPVEIYFLTHYGLSGGCSTAVVTSGAALSVLLFIIAVPVVFVLSAAYIEVSIGFRTLLVAAGVIGFFFLLAVVLSMKDPHKLEGRLRRFSPRFFRKRPGFDRALQKIVAGVEDFRTSLSSILRAPYQLLVPIFLLTFGFWAAAMLVSPMVLWGLGHPELFWKALLAQMVVSFLLPFVPVPGESGMAEMAFAGVFAVFVPKGLVGVLTGLWRFFMLYLVIIVCGIVFLVSLRDAGKSAKEFRAEVIE